MTRPVLVAALLAIALSLIACEPGARATLQARLPTPIATPIPSHEIPPDDGYMIRSGDTLSEVAVRFGYDTETLARYNGIAHPNRIGIGHRLLFSRSFAPPPAEAIEVGYYGSHSGGAFHASIDEGGAYVHLAGIEVIDGYPRRLTACVDDGAELRLHSFLHERDLWLITDLNRRDKYGDLAADVFVGSIYLNEHLVRNGHAYVSWSAGRSAFEGDLVAAQKLAMKERKGMWGSCAEAGAIQRFESAGGIDYVVGHLEYSPTIFHLADPATGDLLHSATRVSIPVDATWHPSIGGVAFGTPYRNGYRKLLNFFDGGGLIGIAPGDLRGTPLPSPDGNWVIYVGLVEVSIVEMRLVRGDGTDSRPLMRREFGWDDLAWSPDSSKVVFSSSERDSPDGVAGLFIIEIPGGAVRRLTTSPLLDRSVDWSPDGAEIAFERVPTADGQCAPPGSGDCFANEIMAVDVATGATRSITGGTGWGVGAPRWSPDGSRIAFIARAERSVSRCRVDLVGPCGRTGLFLVDRYGGRQHEVVAGVVSVGAPSWSPDGRYLTFTVERSRGDRTILTIETADTVTGELHEIAAGNVCCPGWHVPALPRAEGAFPASIAPKLDAAVDLLRRQIGEAPELGRLLGHLHHYPDRVTFASFGPSEGGFYDFVTGVIYMNSESWATEGDVFAAMLLHELAIALDHKLGRFNGPPDCFDANLRAVNLQLDFWEGLWGPAGKPDDDHPFAVWLNDRLWERTAAPLAFRDAIAAKYPYLCEDGALYHIPWSRPWDGD